MKLFFCDPIGLSSRAADFFARGGFFGTVCTRKLVNLAFPLFLCNPVALLDLANELIAFPADHLNVIVGDRKSTRLYSSHTVISYAVFCLKKKSQQPKDD